VKAVKDLYFTDAKIKTVQDGFGLELHIQGKVGKPKECDGPITCALVGLSNMPTLRFVIKVNPKSKSFSTDISFITPTTVLKTDSTWLEDSNGAGPSPFLEFSVDNFVPEISMGVRLGITFCVENCQNEYKKRGSKGEILAIPGKMTVSIGDLKQNKKTFPHSLVPGSMDSTGIAKSEANYLLNLEDKFLPREISLDGTLAVSVAPNGPPGIGGSLDLVGSWYNVNALPLLHIANARVALDIIPAVPLPIPVGFQLHGKICLGKETLCRIAFGDSEDVASSDKLIKGIAYVGIDRDPDKNYFLAMISETNLFKVLDILGDTVDEAYNQIRDILPAIIGETGVYPMKYDVVTKKNPCTAGMLADVSNNMDCYARVSLASEEHNLKNIKIPSGIAMSGRLKFLGTWFQIEVQVSPEKGIFKVDAQMDPVNMNGLLTIGYSKTQLSSGPKFLIDAAILPIPKCIVEIHGYIDIPIFLLQAEVHLSVGSNGVDASFETNNFLFLPGKVSYSTSWDWAMTSFVFSAKLVDVSLAPKILDEFNKNIKKLISKANGFIDKITGELKKVDRALNNACKEIGMGKGAESVACKGAMQVVKGAVKGVLEVAKVALNGAKKTINGLIHAVMDGLDSHRSAFSINELEFSGSVTDLKTATVNFIFDGQLMGKHKNFQLSVTINTNFDIKKLTEDVWVHIKNRIFPAIRDLPGTVEKEFNKVNGEADKAFKQIGKDIKNEIDKIGKVIGKTAKKIGREVTKGAKKIGKGAKKATKKIGKGIKKIGKGAKKATKKIGNGIKKLFGGGRRRRRRRRRFKWRL